MKRDRDNSKTIITSWVQCVGRSNECKLFTFNLQMRIGNAIAHFTDYVSILFSFNRRHFYLSTELLLKIQKLWRIFFPYIADLW